MIAIAAVELRRLLTDRTALFFGIVLPIAIITVTGIAFGGEPNADVAVVDLDRSERSAELIESLDQLETLNVETADNADAARTRIKRAEAVGGLVIPAGYGSDLDAGADVTVELFVDLTNDVSLALRDAVDGTIASQATTIAATRFIAAAGVQNAATAVAETERTLPPISIRTETVGGGLAATGSRFSYSVPATLVLFTFILSLAVGGVLVGTRQQGLIRRMAAAPIRAVEVIAGIGASRLAYAIVQALLIFIIGAVAFGVDWGNWTVALVLIVIFAGTSTAIGLIIGVLGRREQTVQAVGPPVGIAMGMLGGCMWPLEIVPDSIRQIGHIFPHAWAMDAWIGLIYEGESVALELLVLCGYLIVAVAVATRLLRTRLI